MRKPGSFFSSLTIGLWLTLGPCAVLAQDAAEPGSSPAPEPAPMAAEPAPYPLDLPELHPPGSGLFPNGPRQNPPAATSGHSNGSRRNSLLTGAKQRGRSQDKILAKADGDPLLIRVTYRRDKTTALARDPELTELLRRAASAGTDVQKRTYLREYYVRLFAAIRRINASPEMKVHLALLAQVAQQQYDPKRRVVAGEEDLLNTRETASRERLGR